MITRMVLKFDYTIQLLLVTTTDVGRLEVAILTVAFLFLSGLAHFAVVCFHQSYVRGLEKGINRFRWYEYSLSSSLIICAIAILFGCRDLGSLLLMFWLNASMNLFGLLMEEMNPLQTKVVTWKPFWFGCFAGIGPWGVIGLYLFNTQLDRVPVFVFGIFGAYIIFFLAFPINMVLQYKQVGPWKRYIYGEYGYIALSLVTKTVLAWLVFGGTFQPNPE